MESKWDVTEQAAAYLCTPVTSAGEELPWKTYYASEASFVIGTPSAEMYCDSYSQVPHTGDNVTGNYSFEAVYSYTNNHGYKYKYTDLSAASPSAVTDFETPSSGDGSLDYSIKYNNMYCGVSGAKTRNWWLASPSAAGAYYVCSVRGGKASLSGGADYQNNSGYCPLVSLRSSVIPEVVNN